LKSLFNRRSCDKARAIRHSYIQATILLVLFRSFIHAILSKITTVKSSSITKTSIRMQHERTNRPGESGFPAPIVGIIKPHARPTTPSWWGGLHNLQNCLDLMDLQLSRERHCKPRPTWQTWHSCSPNLWLCYVVRALPESGKYRLVSVRPSVCLSRDYRGSSSVAAAVERREKPSQRPAYANRPCIRRGEGQRAPAVQYFSSRFPAERAVRLYTNRKKSSLQ